MLYLDILQIDRAGGGSSDAQLVLFLPHCQAIAVSIHHKCCDALVTLNTTKTI